MSTENMVNEELQARLQELKDEELTSDKYKAGIDVALKLMDRKIEMDKVELEKGKTTQQLKDDRIDKIVRNCIAGVSVAGGLILTVWGALKSWEFEEHGTVTSSPGRKFIGSLFFRK